MRRLHKEQLCDMVGTGKRFLLHNLDGTTTEGWNAQPSGGSTVRFDYAGVHGKTEQAYMDPEDRVTSLTANAGGQRPPASGGTSEPPCSAPYILRDRMEVERLYNPAFGDDRVCVCGHKYYRHFDTYENMKAVGCKYCGCFEFKEQNVPPQPPALRG